MLFFYHTFILAHLNELSKSLECGDLHILLDLDRHFLLDLGKESLMNLDLFKLSIPYSLFFH